MPRRLHRTNSTTSSRRRAIAWCWWLLLVTTWQAPVPLCHSHDALHSVSAASLFEQTHLALHRGGNTDEQPVGWHLHFVLPWSLADSCRPDEPTSPSNAKVVADWTPTSSADEFGRCEVDHSYLVSTYVEGCAASDLQFFAPSARPIGLQGMLVLSPRLSWRSLARIARC